ncbi:hypothetical protein [Salinispora tropica]|uniref:Uncharacterized protein n=1 Tax=Salinispora tropica (strain ATCC BAA-916 / DSM 44818 / JCM 13857 / NBRC 105044 / CNB-440) TaxID=369723 RepID=A4X4E1_SALTO|nr:hypothetical protein [Salinispora tropica]ABP53741.1 hypothetical protein Strop_1271 [Salinispora tropica CNB-440]
MRTVQLPHQRHGITEPSPMALTRYLVVLTDVRSHDGGRDERASPERRRQVVGASSREAAERIAGAFMALGMVRAGRQRVKLIAIGRRRIRG